jgi:3-deoxy-D-manno-octulosonic-acid transferase
MRLILKITSYFAFWLGLPIWLFHPKLRAGFKARLGFVDIAPRAPHVPRIWVHGASAGDVQALVATVREIYNRLPSTEIVVSTITNSGRAMANKMHEHFTAVTYLPYDLPGAAYRSLTAINPDVLILEYTELWPNLIYAAETLDIPVVLHNGRIAGSKLHRYRVLFALFGNLLQKLSLLLMRDAAESKRVICLGAAVEDVFVTGDTKFDNLGVIGDAAQSATLRAATGLGEHDLVWVAGSTHEGEEDILLDVLVQLRRMYPQLKMVVAPRYISRIDKIKNLAERRHLRVSKRSSMVSNFDVILLDTIGELAACYALASVVFVGGSLIPHGGHNILEPAACAKPVLFGPYMENFIEPLQILLGHGGIQVTGGKQLQQVLADLLARPEHCRELGKLAGQKVLSIGGAAARNAEKILELLPEKAGYKMQALGSFKRIS